MESKFIQTASGQVHAKVAGTGEPVLLVHGYSPQFNSWRTWEKNVDALAARNRAYALDLLGYGESDKPELRLDAAGQAEMLIQLMAEEKIERACLVGLSWGGTIVQLVAAAAPARVRKLVLVDSAYEASARGLSEMKKIRCPTLIVWDEEDEVIPVQGAQVLGNGIPEARVRIFKHAERDPEADPKNRHWSQVTHSREWNRVVGDFLAEA